MEQFFDPQSIAVIGANDKPNAIGSALMDNIIQGGFRGTVIPINPHHETVRGLKAYATITEVEPAPEMAIIATPIATAPEIVRQCVRAGTQGVIIISAGGKELGEEGALIEEQIQGAAEGSGMRIIGPNCMGVIRPNKNLNATFAGGMPAKGSLAVISQSGAICAAILDRAAEEHMGFSHFVSIGSMLDVDFGDMIDYLGNDGSVKAILLYMENLTNPRKFMSAARSVSRIKPIIVLKAGKSQAGARAASTHIGAMAGEDAVYDAAFKRAGIVRVPSLARLFDCAELTAKQPRPAGTRLAIVTNGGGPGVMAADTLAEYGLEPARIPDEIMTQLGEILPPYWSRGNPIDILGNATVERYTKALEICLASREFDGILVIMVPQDLTPPEEVARALVKLVKRKRVPVFAAWMGGKRMAEAINILNQANIPTYETPERAVRAFLYLHEYTRNLELLSQVPPKLATELYFNRDQVFRTIYENFEHENLLLSEMQSKEILAAYGIPVNDTRLAATIEEVIDLAAEMEMPLAMKLVSPDISHKSDANGVQLDLRNEDDLRAAFQRIMDGARAHNPEARILGVTLQTFIAHPDFELLIGSKTDDNFGPVICFGSGGVFAEVLDDKALGLPPLNRLLARRMMEETRILPLLKGYRNSTPADLEKLEELLMRLSQLVIDFPEIVELDINPVLVKNGEPCAVDARIRLERVENGANNLHLVISPYPQHLERHDLTDMQMPLFIRPIKPEDAPLFVELFNSLTPTSIYYRFFSVVKTLSPEILARFTQIDYDREISFVGLDDREGEERMLGVANIVGEPDGKRGEFSVLIGDPWQGKGIGAKLLLQCLSIAQERGMEIVWGTVLAENRYMIALGKKLGFTVKQGEDPAEYKLTIDLKTAKL
ncbi:CoA-binding domain protein [Desulfobulbus propionicus DSM 2032]|uniref:CoA-binding domain protein n=1 Tax=Desulfobulbus propionicus (strain ATCC 33891 / DSM 2032 / VKM B-1956 / 1pr3) TaxID=577650 RepID=A0A7U4DPN7_DESPD|nr:GNAT family N-acetyltransferase [Desulfobulbus propionicus]ADW18264.1 CoA-binding domain protein [Desulfobulbus propionicus DSM 2032]